jgi:hypothetical protein
MSLLTKLEILGAGFLQRWRAYGASENSPAIHGWVKHPKNQKSRRDDRMSLSSLTGLGNLGGRKPTAKAVGYFQKTFSA